MKKKLVFVATLAIVLTPLLVFGQTSAATCSTGTTGTLVGIICEIKNIINIVIPVLIIGAIAYFIYGVVKFMTASDAETQGEARSMMINGIIAFAVILGLFGLVHILLNTFSVGTGTQGIENQLPNF